MRGPEPTMAVCAMYINSKIFAQSSNLRVMVHFTRTHVHQSFFNIERERRGSGPYYTIKDLWQALWNISWNIKELILCMLHYVKFIILCFCFSVLSPSRCNRNSVHSTPTPPTPFHSVFLRLSFIVFTLLVSVSFIDFCVSIFCACSLVCAFLCYMFSLLCVWGTLCLCAFLCYMFSVFCVWGAENGSAYEGNCFWVRRSFVEDGVGAEIFVRTWVATERRCI